MRAFTFGCFAVLLAPALVHAQATSEPLEDDLAEDGASAEPATPAEDAEPATASPTTRAAPAPRSARPATAPASSPPPRAAGPAGAPGVPQSRPDPEAEEEEEEEEDGGDPYDFLWIDLAGGVSYVDLRALDATNFYPEFVRLSGTGPMGSLAVGFRIEFFAAGVRATLAGYGDGFDVGTATGEVTLMLPIPVVKPYLRAGFGLGWHGDSNFNAPANSQTTVLGFAFNGAVGLDVYLTEWFSIGAAMSVDILNMNRQRTSEPIDPADAGTVRFEETGDAVGIQVRGQAGVTFHL